MRVLSYNICAGGGDRLDALATVIRGERADAVALYEATPESAATLAQSLGMELVFGAGNSRFDHHVAWLSARAVRRSHNHRLPALANTLLEIDVADVRLFATHLTSRHEEQAHPRAGEVDAILRALGSVEGAHLLVGDLNALEPGDAVGEPPPGVAPRGEAVAGAVRGVLAPLRAAGYVDCYRCLHPREPGWTYPAHAPWLRIDYAFVPANMARRVRACDVVASRAARSASDHLPLRVVLDADT